MAREIVESPMSGKILSVTVKVGDMVKEDQEMVILEAMKMENPICAPVSGKVAEVKITPGQQVESGHVMIVIEH
jgi:acetyl-CoA carboxylase biotin carboxyl carrier protein